MDSPARLSSLNPKTCGVKIASMSGKATAMNRLIRRSVTFPVVASALVVAILFAGLPMLAGVRMSVQDSRPAFTLDICHPIGGAVHAMTPCAAPLVPSQRSLQALHEAGVADESVVNRSSRLNEAPIPPPPKFDI